MLLLINTDETLTELLQSQVKVLRRADELKVARSIPAALDIANSSTMVLFNVDEAGLGGLEAIPTLKQHCARLGVITTNDTRSFTTQLKAAGVDFMVLPPLNLTLTQQILSSQEMEAGVYGDTTGNTGGLVIF